MNDYVDDIKDIMAKKRFRDFPILVVMADLKDSFSDVVSSVLPARKVIWVGCVNSHEPVGD